MPLAGSRHTNAVNGNEPLYFKSLAELDQHIEDHGLKEWNSVPVFKGNTTGGSLPESGKLLVCHDYKGGYTESPTALSYTFNFWNATDIFIYFSHQCVATPPPGWSIAAHRHGVKMLGTIMFENSAEEDCLRLVVGPVSSQQTGPASPPSGSNLSTIPLSGHYARLLADLAYARKFDGYLINVEVPLRGGPEQARALSAWVGLLRGELEAKIGSHAELIWYDSVVVNGQLRWQDRLNSFNLPFFLPSTAFFTNYTWIPPYTNLTTQYFLDLQQNSAIRPWMDSKRLTDIYVGVDVWGRGSHGGGGFGSFRALEHISPQSLGLSAAIFGQAWSWETQQDEPGWTWEHWWARERRLWLGPAKTTDVLPMPPPRHESEANCGHGEVVPIAQFFTARPAPDPAVIPFYTSFSPGVGRAWFVEGRRVLESGQGVTHGGKDWEKGWTDVAHQTSLGSLLWPAPSATWEHDQRDDAPPSVAAYLTFNDAWLGGSSVLLELDFHASEADDAFFQCVFVPIETVACTPGQTYALKLWYKIKDTPGTDLDVGLTVKESTGSEVEVTPAEPMAGVGQGWQALSVYYMYHSGTVNSSKKAGVTIGMVFGMAAEDPTQNTRISVLVGQVSITSLLNPEAVVHTPKISWASFKKSKGNPNSNQRAGELRWDVAATFPLLQHIVLVSPEDPQPAWPTIQTGQPEHSPFLYFNVFVHAYRRHTGLCGPPETATFVGTTGLDGRLYRFVIEQEMLPLEAITQPTTRFFVQGVTHTGEILPWDRCAFVDVDWE